MTFDDWLSFGIKNGYCSLQYCYTHDGLPMTLNESELWSEGEEPCIHVVRLGTEKDWDANL